MGRKKKGKAIGINTSQEAARAHREQRTPPEPVSPQGSPPRVPYNAYRRGLETNSSSTDEAASGYASKDLGNTVSAQNVDGVENVSNLDDHEEEDPDTVLSELRNVWAKLGFYEHHPNHNPANASENQLKAMLRSHEKLGPVLKDYKILLNQSKKRILLLQYPNREFGQEYRTTTGQKPLELRIKPKCGIVEVDIPMNVHSNFDEEKGLQYGQALRNSHLLQQGGSYGLSGGFGVGPRPGKDNKRAAQPEGPSFEKLLENFDDSNNKGHVMNKITLGGRIVPFRDGDPIYMTATFKGDICTWTKLDAMVQLRPQFGHIDALNEPDKSVWRQERAFDERAAARPEVSEPQAVNMAVKSADNNEDLDMYGGMSDTAKLLKAMRDEPWQRMEWVDQDDDESYKVFDENLVYQYPDNASQLISEMTDEQFLDAISCPRQDLTKQGKKILAGDLAGDEVPTAGSETAVDEVGDLSLDDTEDEDDEDKGEDGKALPPGVILPDYRMYSRIEPLCRQICIKGEGVQNACETLLKQKLRGRAEYSFLFPQDPHHLFYKWRLAENRAGRGYPPEDDNELSRDALAKQAQKKK